MNITVELPPDLEQRVREIPDFERRVAEFLRDQADLEQWRSQRYGTQARRLLERSKDEADALSARYSRSELFDQFFELRDRITSEP